MNLKLILSKEDWIQIRFEKTLLKTIEFIPKPDLLEHEIIPLTEYYAIRNKEKEDYKSFRALVDSTPDKDTLLEFKSKYLNKAIIESFISLYHIGDNKYILTNLFKNNNMFLYYDLIDRVNLSNNKYSSLKVKTNTEQEDYYVDITKHTLMISNPLVFQKVVLYLNDMYDNNVDEETIQHDFHKALRQEDRFDNPHIEMILYNLMCLSDIPYKVIKLISTYNIMNINKLTA